MDTRRRKSASKPRKKKATRRKSPRAPRSNMNVDGKSGSVTLDSLFGTGGAFSNDPFAGDAGKEANRIGDSFFDEGQRKAAKGNPLGDERDNYF